MDKGYDLAWAILIVSTPSDPQIGVEYLFTTLNAVLALVATWATAGRSPPPSQAFRNALLTERPPAHAITA